MKVPRFYSTVLLACAMFGASCAIADEAPKRPERHPAPNREMARRQMMRQYPLMAMARLVPQELKAYKNSPTPENFAALEKALDAAVKADTAKRKANLEKQLAELDKKQSALAADFLAKVKSGEFKMPERPQRRNRGERPARKFAGERPEPPACD